MAKIVSIANLKGGVGKSTIAYNLASALAGPKSRVHLIDADAQGTCAHLLDNGDLPIDGAAMPIEDDSDVRHWIGRVLAVDADVVVIDCPPHLSNAAEAAMGLADLVVIPVGPSTAEVNATAKALALVHIARRRRVGGAPKVLMVPSRVDRRTAIGRDIDGLLKGLGEPVAPGIRQLLAFAEAYGAGRWIGRYAPGSDAHADVKALTGRVRRALRP